MYPEAVEGLAGIRAGRVGPPLRLLAAAAVLIATVWLAAAPAARASAAASPFVLAPGVGLYDQFGYAPAYTRNVPAFDESGRAYIRSRTSSGSATSYVHTRDAGSWVRLDFLAALRAAYPSFVQTVGAGGLRNDGLVFDRQGRAYNPVTLQVRDGSTRNAMLVSWDHCRTWKVFKLPQGTFTTERWVGHNELDGPPFLAIWRTSAPPDLPGSQTNTLYVTQPRLEGDQLVLPPLVKVTDRCLGLSRDSGGASFAVTRGGTTWFVWSEIAPDGKGGTPHYVGTYDHATGMPSGRRKLATSPDRSDPHDKPGICLDSAGYLHVIAGGHGSPALYTRSLAPLSAVSGWTVPVPVLSTGWASTSDPTVQQGRQTYPAFVCDSHDTLHLVTRQWRRGVDPYHDGKSYAALVHQSCASGGAWGEPTVIVAGAYPGYGVFFHKLALDARDRLFLSASWQGGPELKQEKARGAALSVLGRSQLRPGKYRSRMLLVSDDGGASWRFAADADLDGARRGRAPGGGAVRRRRRPVDREHSRRAAHHDVALAEPASAGQPVHWADVPDRAVRLGRRDPRHRAPHLRRRPALDGAGRAYRGRPVRRGGRERGPRLGGRRRRDHPAHHRRRRELDRPLQRHDPRPLRRLRGLRARRLGRGRARHHPALGGRRAHLGREPDDQQRAAVRRGLRRPPSRSGEWRPRRAAVHARRRQGLEAPAVVQPGGALLGGDARGRARRGRGRRRRGRDQRRPRLDLAAVPHGDQGHPARRSAAPLRARLGDRGAQRRAQRRRREALDGLTPPGTGTVRRPRGGRPPARVRRRRRRRAVPERRRRQDLAPAGLRPALRLDRRARRRRRGLGGRRRRDAAALRRRRRRRGSCRPSRTERI